MPDKTAPAWAYSLPSTLVLMVPFDLLASLAMDVYLPVVPQMPSALNTSTVLVQFTLSIYILILGLGQIVFGPLSDRIGRRPVVLGGAILFSGASLSLALANDGDTFLALRILQALGASAALVGTFATVRDVFADKPEGTTIYGFFSAILAFVPALAPLLGALIAHSFGWRAIFITLGMMGVLAAVRAWPRWHETRPGMLRNQGPAFRLILASKPFWVYTLGFSAAMGAFFVFFSIASRVLINGAGFSQIAFSVAFGTVAIAMIITTRFVGFFVGRWGIAGSFARGACVMLAGAAILAMLSALAAPGFVTFVMPMWLIAIGIVMLVSVTANGALRGFDDSAGTAVALYYCIQSLIVSALGTLAILALHGDTAWPELVAYSTVMPAASLISLAALKQK